VSAVEVTGPRDHDSLQFTSLLTKTARRFTLKRVSADKAYSAARILAQIEAVGAQPLIPFKKNATGASPYRKRPSEVWERAFHLYSYRRQEFLAHYHQRSNVETAFAMIKAKFGARIRSKSRVAQVNEILCKVLCHNLCCLVQSFYELKIEAEFWKAS
jgi:transposase